MKRKTILYRPTLLLSLASLAVFFLFLLFLPSQNIILSLPNVRADTGIKELNFALPTPAPYPIKKISTERIPEITAESYLAIDMDSDTILFSKNKDAKLKIASITKLMTALVALDLYKPNDILTVKRDFTEGAIIGLLKNEKIRFDELLKALLIPSANDAAQTIADNSPTDFVRLMNKKAREIHLNNTLFSNPQGFDDGNNYSTVLDLSRIGEYVLRFPVVEKIVGSKEATISNADKTKTYTFSNVNQLLFDDTNVHGIKTGNTDEAGECLMSLFEENGHRIIIVILKSSDRFGESERLAEFTFSNFIWVKPQGQVL